MKERVAKGHGAAKEIMNILEGVFFGDDYIAAFKLLRDSKLISLLTYNTEVMHGLTSKNIKHLDKVDLMLTCKALQLTSKLTRCLILFGLGLVPVEYVIKRKEWTIYIVY